MQLSNLKKLALRFITLHNDLLTICLWAGDDGKYISIFMLLCIVIGTFYEIYIFNVYLQF